MVKKTKNSENIAPLLNTNFIKSISVLYMLQIYFWHPIQFFNKFQRPNYFGFYFFGLLFKEVLKVVLIKNNMSFPQFIPHVTKIIKLF